MRDTCFVWGFFSIFLCCSSKPWRSFASERLNIQNNSVFRQKAVPWTSQVPKNANDVIAHMDLLTYLQKYLQVLHYSCHTANGAGLRSWLFPPCCAHHIGMSLGLIPRAMATFGPLDVLFAGSPGVVRTAEGGEFKRPKQQITREVGSKSENDREVSSDRSSRHGIRGCCDVCGSSGKSITPPQTFPTSVSVYSQRLALIPD